jgi:integrase
MARPTGIDTRHTRTCRSKSGGRCNCDPTYRARIHRDGKRIVRTFPTMAAARAWREDAAVALRERSYRHPAATPTLREAAEEWLEGAWQGRIRTRSGGVYKPSAIRSYERAMKLRVLPDLGGRRLADIHRRDLQDLTEKLIGEGLSPSTIRNTIDPVRAIFRRAVRREDVAVNPTSDLEVPHDRGRRERVATPAEARQLLDALPDADRALWATALFTGARRGELRELRWSDIDLRAGIIAISRTLDDDGDVVATKTDAGDREVPILSTLRTDLVAHKLLTGRSGGDLVFGRTATLPFVPSTVRRRAIEAWEAAGLEPIALHECRHSAASEMRAAGLDFKLIQTIIGHSSVTTTFDRYTHVSREHLQQAAERFGAHVEAACGPIADQ